MDKNDGQMISLAEVQKELAQLEAAIDVVLWESKNIRALVKKLVRESEAVARREKRERGASAQDHAKHR